MNKYDEKFMKMDRKTANAFAESLNSAMGQNKTAKKKTTKKTTKKNGK